VISEFPVHILNLSMLTTIYTSHQRSKTYNFQRSLRSEEHEQKYHVQKKIRGILYFYEALSGIRLASEGRVKERVEEAAI
jgi:hypothetical protein